MTYCVGLDLRHGIVLLSDTRTNAGIDHVSHYGLILEPGTRHHGRDCAEHHHQDADPNPGNERIQVSFDNRPTGIGILPLVYQVKIFLCR